jgi:uncharacterized damage-inducible protein DinB
MEILDYMHRQMASMHSTVDATMKDVTVEQFNWAPPGTMNTISATFIHLTSVEDNFVQGILQGKPRIWDSGGWSEKTGVKKTPSIGENWDEFKHLHLTPAAFLEYQKAVWAATEAYMAGLTAKDLDRKVKLGTRELTVAELLMMAANQSLSHTGEIAALKGVQGAKGLPM